MVSSNSDNRFVDARPMAQIYNVGSRVVVTFGWGPAQLPSAQPRISVNRTPSLFDLNSTPAGIPPERFA